MDLSPGVPEKGSEQEYLQEQSDNDTAGGGRIVILVLLDPRQGKFLATVVESGRALAIWPTASPCTRADKEDKKGEIRKYYPEQGLEACQASQVGKTQCMLLLQ